MKRVWGKIGQVLFWLSWPLTRSYLFFTKRTRVLLLHDNKVLVVKNWFGDGRWSLPGGGRRHKETPEEAICRELYEETGVEIQTKQLKTLFYCSRAASGMGFAYECFITSLTSNPTIKTVRMIEILEVQWFEPTALTTQNAAPDVLKALATA